MNIELVVIFIAGILVGHLLTSPKKTTSAEAKAEALDDVERATLSAYTGTSVTEIKKSKVEGGSLTTIFFDYELSDNVTRSTYVAVPFSGNCSTDYTAALINAVQQAKE